MNRIIFDLEALVLTNLCSTRISGLSSAPGAVYTWDVI